MIGPSALSCAAVELRKHLADEIVDLQENDILIGHPGNTLSPEKLDGDRSVVNLFFYHIELSGCPAYATSSDQHYVHLFCLLTPAASAESNEKVPSTGERDLRLLGQLANALFRKPVLKFIVDQGAEAHLEIIPHSISLDDLNKIWSTQPGVAYRPSLAYELALMPMQSIADGTPAPKARFVTVDTTLNMKDRDRDVPPSEPSLVATVPVIEAKGRGKGWVPHLCLIRRDGRPTYTFESEPGVQQLSLRLLANGPIALSEQEKKLGIVAEYWREEYGWKFLIIETTLEVDEGKLDPNRPNGSKGQMVTFQFEGPGQLWIRAKRHEEGIDGPILSNAVLAIIPGEVEHDEP